MATRPEKRIFKRIRFNEAVHFEHTNAFHFGGTLANDLSEGGLRINFSDFVPLGTELSLQITLTNDRVVDLKGHVVWVEKKRFSDQYEAGIEFERSDYLIDAKRKIHRFVDVR